MSPEKSLSLKPAYDVVVVGGGPAGATCANYLQRAGHDVLVVEKARHPRFAIGESLLPRTQTVWQELGLTERFDAAGFLPKHGAYFTDASGRAPEYFHFSQGRFSKHGTSYEVHRAEFDKILWDAAAEVGATCVDRTSVSRFLQEGDRVTGVEVVLEDGSTSEIAARLVVDCSGQATLLGKQLGIREADPLLKKVAMYTHYEGVILSTGDDAGTIAIVASRFGWMWLIPFTGGTVSVGAVIDTEIFKDWKQAGLDREGIWDAILSEVPAIGRRLATAKRCRPLETTANFSYRCSAFAGDGWVLVGDAAAFVDPVFSSGVHLAMTGARRAARSADRALQRAERLPTRRDFAGYERSMRTALRIFTDFIYAWYDESFREIFMWPPRHRPGVEFLKTHVIALLAGEVFQRWRLIPLKILLFFGRLQSKQAGRARERRLPRPGGS